MKSKIKNYYYSKDNCECIIRKDGKIVSESYNIVEKIRNGYKALDGKSVIYLDRAEDHQMFFDKKSAVAHISTSSQYNNLNGEEKNQPSLRKFIE